MKNNRFRILILAILVLVLFGCKKEITPLSPDEKETSTQEETVDIDYSLKEIVKLEDKNNAHIYDIEEPYAYYIINEIDHLGWECSPNIMQYNMETNEEKMLYEVTTRSVITDLFVIDECVVYIQFNYDTLNFEINTLKDGIKTTLDTGPMYNTTNTIRLFKASDRIYYVRDCDDLDANINYIKDGKLVTVTRVHYNKNYKVNYLYTTCTNDYFTTVVNKKLYIIKDLKVSVLELNQDIEMAFVVNDYILVCNHGKDTDGSTLFYYEVYQLSTGELVESLYDRIPIFQPFVCRNTGDLYYGCTKESNPLYSFSIDSSGHLDYHNIVHYSSFSIGRDYYYPYNNYYIVCREVSADENYNNITISTIYKLEKNN